MTHLQSEISAGFFRVFQSIVADLPNQEVGRDLSSTRYAEAKRIKEDEWLDRQRSYLVKKKLGHFIFDHGDFLITKQTNKVKNHTRLTIVNLDRYKPINNEIKSIVNNFV